MSYATQSFEGAEFVVIEGLGEQGSGSGGDEGIAVYSGSAPSGNYTPIKALLPSGASSVGVESNPQTGTIKIEAFTVQLIRTDTLAKQLLYTPTQQGLDTLSADLSTSGSSFTVSSASAGLYSAGDVVFIGNEAMRITGDSGGGTYTVSRAKWSTKAEPHEAGSVVYTRNPLWKTRRIERWVINDSGSPVQRASGQIESISGTDDGTRITIRASSVLSPASRVILNSHSPDFLKRGDSVTATVIVDRDNGNLKQLTGRINTVNVLNFNRTGQISRVFKPGSSGSNPLSKPVALQVGPALTVGIMQGVGDITFGFAPFFGTSYEVQSVEGEAYGEIVGPIHELAVVSQTMDSYLDGLGEEKVSFTRDLDYPYHPLSIIGALFLSNHARANDAAGFNVLNGFHWGAAFGDHMSIGSFLTDLYQLIEDTRWMKVDDLILGWDGEGVDPWEVAKNLARFFGFGFGTDEIGGPTIYRARPADVSDLSRFANNTVRPVRHNDDPLIAWDSVGTESYSSLVVNLGERPWGNPPVPAEFNIRGVREARSASFNKAAILDAPFISPGNASPNLINAAVMAYYSFPSLTIYAEDHERESLDYSIGAIVRLASQPMQRAGELLPWLLGRDGELTSDFDSEQFLGRLTGRHELSSARVFRLVLKLFNWRLAAAIKWRGPSAVVTANGVEGEVLTVEVQSPSVFGALSPDGDEDWFSKGDEVLLYSRNLLLDSSNPATFQVISINPGRMDLGYLGGTPTTFTGDRILRLAPYDPTSGAGYTNTVLSGIARAYAFFGNNANPVEIGDGQADGDYYGA